MRITTTVKVRRTSGFTLIELMIAATLLGMLISSVSMIGQANERAYETGAIAADLEARAARAMEVLVTELRLGRLGSVTPDPEGVGAAQIDYVHATGIVGGIVQDSALRRITLELDPGELDDGLDNNSNGLVDERQLVLIENVGEADERRRVLTRWVAEDFEGEEANGDDDNGNGLVDEPGFVIDRSERTLVLRLTVQKRDDEGRLMSSTAESAVRLRN